MRTLFPLGVALAFLVAAPTALADRAAGPLDCEHDIMNDTVACVTCLVAKAPSVLNPDAFCVGHGRASLA